MKQSLICVQAMIIASLLLMQGKVQAAPIQFDYGASIVGNTTGFTSVSAGDAVTGSIEFDSEIEDSIPNDPVIGSYTNGPITLDLNLAGLSFTDDRISTTSITVSDNRLIGGQEVDSLRVVASPLGSPIDGMILQQVIVTLNDLTASAFNSDALPTSLDLSAFQESSIFMSFFDPAAGRTRQLFAGINTVIGETPADVPEPRTFYLLLIALAAVGIAAKGSNHVRFA